MATSNHEPWSDARYHAFIVSILRAGSRRYPPKYEVLKEAYVDTRINPETKRLSKHYRCAECRELFPSRRVQVDHKEPVIGTTGFKSWDDYIERLYCSKSNLQTLCLTCHKTKTQLEKQLSLSKRK